jgi:hypothetical protein
VRLSLKELSSWGEQPVLQEKYSLTNRRTWSRSVSCEGNCGPDWSYAAGPAGACDRTGPCQRMTEGVWDIVMPAAKRNGYCVNEGCGPMSILNTEYRPTDKESLICSSFPQRLLLFLQLFPLIDRLSVPGESMLFSVARK